MKKPSLCETCVRAWDALYRDAITYGNGMECLPPYPKATDVCRHKKGRDTP